MPYSVAADAVIKRR